MTARLWWLTACLVSAWVTPVHPAVEVVLWQDACDRQLPEYRDVGEALQLEIDATTWRSRPGALRLEGEGALLLTPVLQVPPASVMECRLSVRGEAAAYLAFVSLPEGEGEPRLLGEAPVSHPGGGGWIRPVLRLDHRDVPEPYRVAVRLRKGDPAQPLWVDDVEMVRVEPAPGLAAGAPLRLRGWVSPADVSISSGDDHWELRLSRIYADPLPAGEGALPVEVLLGGEQAPLPAALLSSLRPRTTLARPAGDMARPAPAGVWPGSGTAAAGRITLPLPFYSPGGTGWLRTVG